MFSLVSTMNLSASSYGYGSKLDKPQEDDDDQSTGSSTSKDKRGKLGFRSVLKKCASLRGLCNNNDSSSRSLTTQSAHSIGNLSVEESGVACQVVGRDKAPSSSVKASSSPKKLLLPTTNGATIKRPGLPPRACSVRSLQISRAVNRSENRMDGRRAHSDRPLSVEESDLSCQVVVRGKAPSSPVKAPSSPKLLLPTTKGATIKRPGLPYRSCSVRSLAIPSAVPLKEERMDGRRSHSARPLSVEESDVTCQVVVRGKAPSSPKLLLPTTKGATIKRPGIPYRSCSVRSLAIPSAVPRREKRMDVRRSHSARPFSTETEEFQTQSLEKAKNKCKSLHDYLQEYDDIIMLDEYAEFTSVHQQTKESSLADFLDAYSRIVNEGTDSMKHPSL
jgi:hypothetical protein